MASLQSPEKQTLLTGVIHISLVVYDAEKTAKKLEKYGIGPFKFHQSTTDHPSPENMKTQHE
jgi:hypothetical protein